MRRGFTLNEILITVVIVAVLAMIALPQYFGTVEKMRCAEGKAALLTLYNAQLRYYAEHDHYAGDIDDLDLGYTDGAGHSIFKHFSVPVAIAGIAGDTGSVQRNGGDYTLYIQTDGTFECTESKKGMCAKMGVEPR